MQKQEGFSLKSLPVLNDQRAYAEQPVKSNSATYAVNLVPTVHRNEKTIPTVRLPHREILEND